MRTVYLNGIRYRITHVQDSGYVVYRSRRDDIGWMTRTYVYGPF